MSWNSEKQAAEDQYLDLIIHLAFERKADLEVEQLMNETDPELTDEETTAADKAFQIALSEEDARIKEEKREHSVLLLGKTLLNACKVAACLIIIAGIALPIAVATSAQFRSKVMQLLMEIDTVNQEAYFHFVENEDEAFLVPEDWAGEWFPTFIPDDMTLTGIEHRIKRAEYQNEKNGIFWFYELGDEANAMVGIEDANIEMIDINGEKGWLLFDETDKQRITIVWSKEDRWFKLDSSLITKEDILAIAQSVKKIIR